MNDINLLLLGYNTGVLDALDHAGIDGVVVLDDAGHISNLNRPKRFTKELRAAFERAEGQRLTVA